MRWLVYWATITVAVALHDIHHTEKHIEAELALIVQKSAR